MEIGDIIDVLHSWESDNKHKTNFVDTEEVVTSSVTNDSDCRACDLKDEFNKQINASSAVIIVIGDKTASRTAGSIHSIQIMEIRHPNDKDWEELLRDIHIELHSCGTRNERPIIYVDKEKAKK